MDKQSYARDYARIHVGLRAEEFDASERLLRLWLVDQFSMPLCVGDECY